MINHQRLFLLGILAAFAMPLSVVMAASESKKAATTETGKAKGKLIGDEERFIKEAASSGMMEVSLGKVAAEKGANSQVKEFGKRMQTDHSKANERLKKIASDKGVEIPKEPAGEHKRTMDRLMKLSGAEFDREYMEAMVDAHEDDIEKFERIADRGKDPDLRKFAADQLPILKKHLELAQATHKQLKGEGKSKPATSKPGSKDAR